MRRASTGAQLKSMALYITIQQEVVHSVVPGPDSGMVDPIDVVNVATALRRRIDPHVSRETGRNDWSEADLLAVAMIARQELAREFNCETTLFYKNIERGPQPLIRLTRGDSAVDLDMAADRIGPDAVRAEARGQLYSDLPDRAPFVSADVYDEAYQTVAAIVERAGLTMSETEDGGAISEGL
jgi:hypothetical protein